LVLPCLGNYPRAWALARFRPLLATRHSYRDVRIQERRTSTYLQSLLARWGGAVLAVGILVAGGQFKRRGWSEAKPVTAFLSFFGPGFQKDGKSAPRGPLPGALVILAVLPRLRGHRHRKILPHRRPGDRPTLADLLVSS